MGALTLVSKYLVVLSFEVDGLIDKPDVIGAIFSQTEGLLGHDFDLKELQSSGRIGRIEVELERKGDKTVGKIYVPSNLNRYEVALLSAMLEVVDRVGPYPARFKVVEIRDLREEKRKRVLERAKQLLMMIEREVLPDSKEIVSKLVELASEAELIKYGPEGLIAGPDVDNADTIIIVEGRADVVNLVKHGYRNVIAIGGISGEIPKSIVELSKRKTTIVFADGDRGGDMLIRKLIKVLDVDYIARAPPGKEVEELTGKEIAKALKNKISIEDYLSQIREEIEAELGAPKKVESKAEVKEVVQPTPKLQLPDKVVQEIEKLTGTLEGILYDSSWNEIKKVPVSSLVDEMQKLNNVYAVVFDGVCTPRLIDVAISKGVKIIVASRIGSISKAPADVTLMTISDVLRQHGRSAAT